MHVCHEPKIIINPSLGNCGHKRGKHINKNTLDSTMYIVCIYINHFVNIDVYFLGNTLEK